MKRENLRQNGSSDGSAFEKDVLRILNVLGYKVERNVLINNCQVDIYGEYHTGSIPIRLMVECKDYKDNRTVGIMDINKFAGVLAVARNNGAVDIGLFVTTNGFTADAKVNALAAGITLRTNAELSTQLVNFDAYVEQIIREFEDSPISKFYIELSGTETEDYELEESAIFFRPVDDFIQRCLFLENREKLALLGNFGTGKSTFCKRYAYTLAQAYKSDKTGRVPILISLKDYDARFDIQTLILNTLLTKYGVNITPAICQALQRIGKFMLLFDGFDEMDAKANPDTIRENLRELNKVSEIKGNKFVITCRTHFFRNKIQAEVLADFDIAYIPEWGEMELREYLQKRFGSEWKKYVEQISGTHNLPELAKTPLFLEMIAETLPKLGDNVKRVELYQVYTDNWIKNQSRRKGALLTPYERRNFIKELAVKLYSEGRMFCHYKEFKDILRLYLTQAQPGEDMRFEIDDAVQMDYLRNDVQTCTFLVRDSAGNYSFRHKSFMEFFVAKAISEDIRSGSCKYLEGSILPVEIRGFLVDFLSASPPSELLINWATNEEETILRDNLLLLISQLRIKLPTPRGEKPGIADPKIGLAVRFLQGDTAAFDQLYRTYCPSLYVFMRRSFNKLSSEEIEDIIAEAFFRLWERRSQLESFSRIKNYLYALAQNKGLDEIRKKQTGRFPESMDPELIASMGDAFPEDEAHVFSEAMYVTLKEAIGRLSELSRKVIENIYVDGKSASEVACSLGINLHAVYQIRRRALTEIRKHMSR